MTRHSIVRLPGRWASNETATRREVTDVRATGVQSSDGTVKEIVLGVDTHLDVHVAVALDGLGRHLGESKIPTTLREGLRTTPRLGAGFRSCKVRRSE